MNEIDVSKCMFYCEEYDGCYCFNSSEEVYAINPNEHNSCERNTDCYYKQLQKLKQEKEELKDKFNINEQECWDIAFLKYDLAKAEQKLEKIKEYCNKTFNNGIWNGYEMTEKDRKNILQIIEEE